MRVVTESALAGSRADEGGLDAAGGISVWHVDSVEISGEAAAPGSATGLRDRGTATGGSFGAAGATCGGGTAGGAKDVGTAGPGSARVPWIFVLAGESLDALGGTAAGDGGIRGSRE